jgi:hypothetical protein
LYPRRLTQIGTARVWGVTAACSITLVFPI